MATEGADVDDTTTEVADVDGSSQVVEFYGVASSFLLAMACFGHLFAFLR